jgi:hypothetical protein
MPPFPAATLKSVACFATCTPISSLQVSLHSHRYGILDLQLELSFFKKTKTMSPCFDIPPPDCLGTGTRLSSGRGGRRWCFPRRCFGRAGVLKRVGHGMAMCSERDNERRTKLMHFHGHLCLLGVVLAGLIGAPVGAVDCTGYEDPDGASLRCEYAFTRTRAQRNPCSRAPSSFAAQCCLRLQHLVRRANSMASLGAAINSPGTRLFLGILRAV